MRYVQPTNSSIFISSIKFNSENPLLAKAFRVDAIFQIFGIANISEFKFVGSCPPGLEDFLPVSITVDFQINACPSITIQWIGICGQNVTIPKIGLTGGMTQSKSEGIFVKDGTQIRRPNHRKEYADS